jgi:hypothetical protein
MCGLILKENNFKSSRKTLQMNCVHVGSSLNMKRHKTKLCAGYVMKQKSVAIFTPYLALSVEEFRTLCRAA